MAAARPAHAAAPAGRDRRPVRPAGPAAAAGRGDARRRPPGLHVYYVDDHFVPTRAGRSRRAGTPSAATPSPAAPTPWSPTTGRAVAFATGDPSGLAATLPGAGPAAPGARPGAAILLGFDRGGSYPVAFAPSASPAAGSPGGEPRSPSPPRRPVLGRARGDGKPAEVTLADETVQIKDYGQARQITLFEDGGPCCRCSPATSPRPRRPVSWLRCRWRIENLFKYLGQLRHPLAVRLPRQPRDECPPDRQPRAQGRPRPAARGRGGPRCRRARTGHPAHQPGLSPPPRTRPSRPPRTRSPRPGTPSPQQDRLKGIPAKLPASQVTPGAQKAILATRRRACRWCCGCSPPPPSTGSATGSTTTCATPTSTGPSPATCSTKAARSPAPPRITVTLDPPAAPDHPCPRPAHRGDQRNPAPHARRHPAHHLPARGAPPDLTTS